jgi:hypothetical protein
MEAALAETPSSFYSIERGHKSPEPPLAVLQEQEANRSLKVSSHLHPLDLDSFYMDYLPFNLY